MIPDLNQSGVLPPFIAESGPIIPAAMAPYQTTISEFVLRYAKSEERIAILEGLLAYRKKLKSLGIINGFQWIDGSFVENIEQNQGRPPSDVDIVTFASRPIEDDDSWREIVSQNPEIFIPNLSKEKYICDAYFVDLNTHPIHIVNSTKYWFGLFSHQRDTYLWKGMLEIPIGCDDELAIDILKEEIGNALKALYR